MIDLRSRLQAAVGDAYVIDRELGGGGMSRVFVATESSLSRQVVIKVLPPELASEVSQARFKREIELAAHLHHPNILTVLTAGAKDDLLFYVMPFVSGESLRHRLRREAKLPVADALRIMHEVADALAFAHTQEVVHRDIKPENILLLGQHAVLTDFGVARALAEARSGERLTEIGMSVGTPGYMSPEQAAGGQHVDARADLYALAVVGYEMLAGAPPFEGPTAQAVLAAHLTKTARPLKEVRPDVPEAVSVAISRALEKDPADRLDAAEFRNAMSSTPSAGVPSGSPLRPTWRRFVVTGGALAVIAIGAYLVLRPQSEPRLDPNLLAVAPFDVLDPKLSLWREGFVDILSRNLDGAGPLRTVSPSVVVRRWIGRADPASATELGRKTGAGLVVIASLVGVGSDSVRLTAHVVDVNDGQSVGEVDVRGASDHMDRIGDSLAVGLLRELGRTRPIGAVLRTSLGSKSLPALRAFLRGEQFYRRSVWDSAIVSYDRAIALDSSFALALSHLGRALTWKRAIATDSLSLSYSLRAGAFNRGLAPRESLLVAADSVTAAALYGFPRDTLWWSHARRAHATLEEAARRYQEDPDVWYNLGEARVHLTLPGTSRAQQLEPFERAIAVDSAFAPAYYHAAEYALIQGDSAKARRLLSAYAALNATDVFADGLRLAGRLLDPAGARSSDVQRILDTASAEILGTNHFDKWPDSAETAVRLARLLAAGRRSGVPVFRDQIRLQRGLVTALSFRGHMREAYRTALSAPLGIGRIASYLPVWALLGVMPADSAYRIFDSWLSDPELAPLTLPWWGSRADTVSIRKVLTTVNAEVRSSRGWSRARGSYWSHAASAYLALARGDTGGAIRRLSALPDSACVQCSTAPQHLVLVQLLSAQRRDKEAAARLVADYHWELDAVEVLWRLERARVSERLGNRQLAAREYRFVADVWRNADSELRQYVREAKLALRRLGAEPR